MIRAQKTAAGHSKFVGYWQMDEIPDGLTLKLG